MSYPHFSEGTSQETEDPESGKKKCPFFRFAVTKFSSLDEDVKDVK